MVEIKTFEPQVYHEADWENPTCHGRYLYFSARQSRYSVTVLTELCELGYYNTQVIEHRIERVNISFVQLPTQHTRGTMYDVRVQLLTDDAAKPSASIQQS